MVEIVKSGGWLMAPIILCAIIAMGIILERFWTLQQKRVIPEDLTSKVWGWVKKDQLDQKQIQTLHQGSALGQILAAGLINRDRERTVMKDSIEDTGRHVVHELERYLETLGTIAAVSPLLGLLGTVIGIRWSSIWKKKLSSLLRLSIVARKRVRNEAQPAAADATRGQFDLADRRCPAAVDFLHGVDELRQAISNNDQPAAS
jgi:hypothetical protein